MSDLSERRLEAARQALPCDECAKIDRPDYRTPECRACVANQLTAADTALATATSEEQWQAALTAGRLAVTQYMFDNVKVDWDSDEMDDTFLRAASAVLLAPLLAEYERLHLIVDDIERTLESAEAPTTVPDDPDETFMGVDSRVEWLSEQRDRAECEAATLRQRAEAAEQRAGEMEAPSPQRSAPPPPPIEDDPGVSVRTP